MKGGVYRMLTIILYAFSKAKEGNALVSNHMIKHHVLEVIEN